MEVFSNFVAEAAVIQKLINGSFENPAVLPSHHNFTKSTLQALSQVRTLQHRDTLKTSQHGTGALSVPFFRYEVKLKPASTLRKGD